MYYPCSENKGADQLRGYRGAGLRLCFRIMQIVGFLLRRLISYHMYFQVVSKSALEDAKQLVLSAFDDNNDGRIDIAEVCRHFHLYIHMEIS